MNLSTLIHVPLPSLIGSLTVVQLSCAFLNIMGVIAAVINLVNCYKASKSKPYFYQSVLPLIFVYIDLICIFSTKWSETRPALSLLMVMPFFGLTISRMGLCDMAKMPYKVTDMMSWAWFLLIPVNKLVFAFIPEYYMREELLIPIIGFLVLLGYLRFIAGAVREQYGITADFFTKQKLK